MNLNIYTIFEELSCDRKFLYTHGENDFDLCGVRILSLMNADPYNLEDTVIYVVDNNDLVCIPANPNFRFICMGAIEKEIALTFHTVIVVENRISNIMLLQLVQDVFDRYNKWYDGVVFEILNRQPLQDVFDHCTEISSQTIAFFDTSRAMLFLSEKDDSIGSAQLWNDTLKTGYSPEEAFDEALEKRMESSHIPFIYYSDNEYKDFCRLIAPIKIDGILFGCLAASRYDSEITAREYADIFYMQQLFQTALKHSSEFKDSFKKTPWFLTKLLRNESIDPGIIKYNMLKYQKDMDIPFFTWAFIKEGNIVEDTAAIQQYLPAFHRIFEQSFVIIFENQIVVLDNNLSHIENKKFFKKLDLLLKTISYRGAHSMQFHDITNLSTAFMQTQLALDNSHSSHCRIIAFKDIYVKCITQSLIKEHNMNVLLYPNMHKLFENKKMYGEDLLRTLQTYIISGCNISATAEKMFVHRHTITYRINMISQMLGVDINSLDEETRFQIYLSCRLLSK